MRLSKTYLAVVLIFATPGLWGQTPSTSGQQYAQRQALESSRSNTQSAAGRPMRLSPIDQMLGQRPRSQTIPAASNPLAGKFLGWELSRAQGRENLERFVRPYGAIFSAGKETLPALPASASPFLTLPGLDLPTPLISGFLPTGVAAGDFNGDGHLDWVVSNGGSNDVWLYLGNGDGTVQPPRIIPLKGQSPIAIAAVDLRGSGILDLVLAEPDSLTVGVLLGNGDGTFAPEQLYTSPAPPLSLTVADFNRDGHPDVVVGLIADAPIGAVAFFAGDGTGKLLPPVTTPLFRNISPAAVVAAITSGDLNHDGIPDLLVTDQNFDSPGTYVYLGKGDGTFTVGTNLGGILNAAIGDLNGDGCPDVVTIDTLDAATVLLGHCDGTFQLLSPLGFFGEGETGTSIVLADINGDGKLDLITSGISLGVGGAFGQDSGSLISVSFGDGAGGFEPARVYRAQSGMFGLAVADFNGDSHPDIVVASQDTDSVFLFLNDGTGRFAGPQGRYLGWMEKGSPANNLLQGPANATVSLAAVDLNGDGKKDMLAVDVGLGTGPANLVVSLNDGLGNFLADTKIPVLDGQFQFFGNMITGNFRGTGLPDVVLTPNHLSGSLSGSFFVFVPNLGGGSFGTPVTTSISGFPGAIAAGDFNGDGKLDFVMVGGFPAQIVTFLGHGDGTFTPGPSQPFSSNGFPVEILLIGDFNGDGKLDVLVPIRGQLFELLGNGDGTFSAPKLVLSISSFSDASVLFQVADLNGDGRTDLIQRNGFQDGPVPVISVYLAQPDGSFVLQNTYSPYQGAPFFSSGSSAQASNNFVADFNGDGIPDIAVFQLTAALPEERYVQFMLGNGDGTFTPTFQRFHLGVNNAALPNFITDLNGDGKSNFVELDGFTSAFNVIHPAPGKPFSLQFVSLPVMAPAGLARISLAIPSTQDTVFTINATDPNITVPGSVTVTAGTLGADVSITVGPAFDQSRVFTVTATNGTVSATAMASVATPGGAVGLFSGLVSPIFRALLPGQSSGNLGYAIFSRGGYQTSVSLRCDSVPPGITCQLGSQSLDVPAGGSNDTSLVVSVSSSVPVGNYTLDIIAQDASISQSLPVQVPVGDFAIQLASTGTPSLPTGFESFQLVVTSVNNYQNVVGVSCSGLPTAATCPGGQIIAGVGPPNLTVDVTTSGVAAGDYPFTIVGNTGFTTHSVNATLHVGDFGTATVTPGSATLSVGQTANFNLAVTSVNGFTDPVNLSCSTSINGHAVGGLTCSFSPPTPIFDNTGKLTAQITVTAVSRPSSAPLTPQGNTAQIRWIGAAVPILLICVLGIAIPRKKKLGTGITLLVILAFAILASCGGGGGNGGGTGPTPTPTPTPAPTPGPQTVTVTVLGTSTVQVPAPPKTLTSFTVTVQ